MITEVKNGVITINIAKLVRSKSGQESLRKVAELRKWLKQ